MKKVLIVYYSRTGNTEKAALELARDLNADLEQLVDCENRNGPWGYIKSGKHASNKKLTVIEQPKYDPSCYEVIVLATPTWMMNITPALRTYIHYNTSRMKKVVFLVTHGGAWNGKIFEEMRDAVGKLPVAVLEVAGREFKENTWQSKLKEITAKVRLILS